MVLTAHPPQTWVFPRRCNHVARFWDKLQTLVVNVTGHTQENIRVLHVDKVRIEGLKFCGHSKLPDVEQGWDLAARRQYRPLPRSYTM